MSDAETKVIEPKICPVCKIKTAQAYYMTEPNSKSAIWYRCSCGIAFQENKPEHSSDDHDSTDYNRTIHGMHTYANIIEELTYGRKMHDSLNNNINEYMNNRGWVIDNDNPDLIICDSKIEDMDDPLDFLKNCYSILSDSGVIYIDTPDIDFIYNVGTRYFEHWKSDHTYIIWNKESLVRELKRIGYDIILVRRNGTLRYTKSNTVQIIAQKKYF